MSVRLTMVPPFPDPPPPFLYLVLLLVAVGVQDARQYVLHQAHFVLIG